MLTTIFGGVDSISGIRIEIEQHLGDKIGILMKICYFSNNFDKKIKIL